MTTPNQPNEHGRTTGGVRGAINDLLGRDNHPDDERHTDERRSDDLRNDDLRNNEAGTAAPVGARFEGQPVDDGPAADPQPAMQPPTEAPTGARFDGKPADVQPAADPRADQQPMDAPTGARFDGQPGEQQQQRDTDIAGSRTAGAGVVGAAAPEQHTVGDRRPDGPAVDGPTPGSSRHTDVGTDGPGYAAAAQNRPAGNGAGNGSGTVAETSQGEDAEGRERLVSTDRAESYGSRWDSVKGEFVDEPRKAVADADALVGELLDELQTLFTEQRKGIERSMAADETSTEDLRLALRRYRSFFDRLLSI